MGGFKKRQRRLNTAGLEARKYGNALETCNVAKGVWFQLDAPPSWMKKAIYALQSENNKTDGEDISPTRSTCKATTVPLLRGRRCSDMVYTVCQLVEKSWEHWSKVFLLFIDLKKAYNSVPRAAMWRALGKQGVPEPVSSSFSHSTRTCKSRSN